MNELLKLKDIKPNVPVNVPTHYPYYIWIIGILILLSIIFLILFIKKQVQIKKEKLALFSLINNPKKFAYEFTKKGKKFKNKKNEHLFEEINQKLTKYKYKPKVENIDKKTIKLIKKYLEIK